MLTETVRMDRSGRVMLPKPIRNFLNIQPGAALVFEMKETGVLLRPQERTSTITARIAALALPVGDWDQMEREIEAGRLE